MCESCKLLPVTLIACYEFSLHWKTWQPQNRAKPILQKSILVSIQRKHFQGEKKEDCRPFQPIWLKGMKNIQFLK